MFVGNKSFFAENLHGLVTSNLGEVGDTSMNLIKRGGNEEKSKMKMSV